MRVFLVVLGLAWLAACTPPMQTADNAGKNGKSDLYRYIEPTNGAAYSQGDMRYYESGVNPGYFGPTIPPSFHK